MLSAIQLIALAVIVCVDVFRFLVVSVLRIVSTGTATRRLVSSTGSSTRTVRAGDRKLRYFPQVNVPTGDEDRGLGVGHVQVFLPM